LDDDKIKAFGIQGSISTIKITRLDSGALLETWPEAPEANLPDILLRKENTP